MFVNVIFSVSLLGIFDFILMLILGCKLSYLFGDDGFGLVSEYLCVIMGLINCWNLLGEILNLLSFLKWWVWFSVCGWGRFLM